MDNQNIQINNGAPMGYVPPKAPSRVPAFLGGLFTGILVVGLVAAIVLNYYSPAGQANPSAKSDKADDGKQSSKTGTVLDQETINKLARLENYIDEYYLGDYTEEDLKDSLYHGLFKGLNDPYSVYYSPEEMEAFEATESGVYYGIGAYRI